MELQLLPSELLGKIFSHVRNASDRYDKTGQESIKQCRLVSRYFNAVASPFLISEVTVLLTLESFSRLETICRHPIFGKNVRKVIIGLSYYEGELASDRRLYTEEASSRLLRHVETYERLRRYRSMYPMTDERYNWLSGLAWGPTDRLVSAENDNSATPIQKLFSKAYDLYKQKYDNQELLRQNNSHISRLCATLCSLPNLISLELEDKNSWSDKLDAADFLHTGFDRDVLLHFDSIIRRSTWSGYFKTDHSATPPVEMLGLLCSQLGEHGLRPETLGLSLYPPPNMQVWKLQPSHQAGIKQLVSHCRALEVHVDLSRRPYDLKDNLRHEMLALCSITQSLLDTSSLEHLTIEFMGYPESSRDATVSLIDIFPRDMSWPRLHSLHLRYIPATMEELKLLISQHSRTVHNLTWERGFLLEGAWPDAIEIIRDFRALEEVKLGSPMQEGDWGLDWPAEELRCYLLKETDRNPLIREPERE